MDAQVVDELVAAFRCESQADFARLLGVGRQRVNNWKRDGLPMRWRPTIEDLAREQNIELPASYRVSLRKAA